MVHVPDTRPSLLLRIRDLADHKSWLEFEKMYRPMVEGIARSYHLRDEDQDIWQDVALKLIRVIGKFEYDSTGSFAAFVIRVTRNVVMSHFRRVTGKGQGIGGSSAQAVLAAQPAGEGDNGFDSAEDLLGHVRRAVDRLRSQLQERTLAAFWQTAIEDRPAAEVANNLGMSVSAVRLAKFRVRRALQKQLGDGAPQDSAGGEL